MFKEQHPRAGGDPTPSSAAAVPEWVAGSGAARELLTTLVTGFKDSAGRSRGVDASLSEVVEGTVTEALAVLSTIEQLRGVLAHTEATWLMEADARLRGAQEHTSPAVPDGDDAADVEACHSRSLTSQVAMAQRTSPSRASRRVADARRLTRDMPGLLGLLGTATLPREQVHAIAGAAAGTTSKLCQTIDRIVTANPGRLDGMGTRRTREHIATIIADHSTDDEISERTENAARGRHVRMMPLAHGMARVTAELRALDAQRLMETITAAAASDRARGAHDSTGTLAADHLVDAVAEYYERHIHPAGAEVDPIPESASPADLGPSAAQPVFTPDPDGPARGPRLEIGIVITDRALLGLDGDTEPGHLVGYGPIAASTIRDTLCGTPPGHNARDDSLWPPGPSRSPVDIEGAHFRRLYTHPTSGELIAMDARSRIFPTGLRRMISWRDTTCRTPWCNATPRHIDHVRPVHDGGQTSYDNGQGLCVRCNLAKEDGSWTVTPSAVVDPAVEHAVEIHGGRAAERETGDSTGSSLSWGTDHGAMGCSPTPRIERPGTAPRRRGATPRADNPSTVGEESAIEDPER